MKKTIFFAMVFTFVIFVTGCSLLTTPKGATGGYIINNYAESKATIAVGTNGSQTVGVHSALPTGEAGNGETTAGDGKAISNAMFSNSNTGNRSADIDATSAIERLQNVQSSTASQNATRGDTSPNTTTQTPTTTDTHEKTETPTLNIGK